VIGHIGAQVDHEPFSIEDLGMFGGAALGEDQRGARDFTREGGGGEKKGEEKREQGHGGDSIGIGVGKKLVFARFPQPARAVSSLGALKQQNLGNLSASITGQQVQNQNRQQLAQLLGIQGQMDMYAWEKNFESPWVVEMTRAMQEQNAGREGGVASRYLQQDIGIGKLLFARFPRPARAVSSRGAQRPLNPLNRPGRPSANGSPTTMRIPPVTFSINPPSGQGQSKFAARTAQFCSPTEVSAGTPS
jgi:hypothetical protein